MGVPTAVLVPAAILTAARQIWETMGQGPAAGQFSAPPLCSIDVTATPATPPTHYWMCDAGADEALVAEWLAMAQTGALPTPAEGYAWGDVISDADARAAIGTGGAIHVFVAAGFEATWQAVDWFWSQVAALGLQRIPDPVD